MALDSTSEEPIGQREVLTEGMEEESVLDVGGLRMDEMLLGPCMIVIHRGPPRKSPWPMVTVQTFWTGTIMANTGES